MREATACHLSRLGLRHPCCHCVLFCGAARSAATRLSLQLCSCVVCQGHEGREGPHPGASALGLHASAAGAGAGTSCATGLRGPGRVSEQRALPNRTTGPAPQVGSGREPQLLSGSPDFCEGGSFRRPGRGSRVRVQEVCLPGVSLHPGLLLWAGWWPSAQLGHPRVSTSDFIQKLARDRGGQGSHSSVTFHLAAPWLGAA